MVILLSWIIFLSLWKYNFVPSLSVIVAGSSILICRNKMRTNEKLWEEVKRDVQGNKPWNARIAQQAVQEYKRRGGGYTGGDRKKTSLYKWTEEDWGYLGKSKRYLPKKVRDIVERDDSLRREVSKGKKLGTIKEYPEGLKKIMRKVGIF